MFLYLLLFCCFSSCSCSCSCSCSFILSLVLYSCSFILLGVKESGCFENPSTGHFVVISGIVRRKGNLENNFDIVGVSSSSSLVHANNPFLASSLLVSLNGRRDKQTLKNFGVVVSGPHIFKGDIVEDSFSIKCMFSFPLVPKNNHVVHSIIKLVTKNGVEWKVLDVAVGFQSLST